MHGHADEVTLRCASAIEGRSGGASTSGEELRARGGGGGGIIALGEQGVARSSVRRFVERTGVVDGEERTHAAGTWVEAVNAAWRGALEEARSGNGPEGDRRASSWVCRVSAFQSMGIRSLKGATHQINGALRPALAALRRLIAVRSRFSARPQRALCITYPLQAAARHPTPARLACGVICP